ncbi:MAG: hypothetical protein ACRD4V_07685 [Candidatus Acidiferrales bacterium]
MARKTRKESKFEHFVRLFGVEELSRRLKVQPSAVYHWLRGACSPRPAKAIKIQRLAKNRGVALSLDEIYAGRGSGPAA